MSPGWESTLCGDSPDSQNLEWLLGEVEALQLYGSRSSVGPWSMQESESQLLLRAYFVITGRLIDWQETKWMKHFSSADMVIEDVHSQICRTWLPRCQCSILRSSHDFFPSQGFSNLRRMMDCRSTKPDARKRLPLLQSNVRAKVRVREESKTKTSVLVARNCSSLPIL